MYEAADRFDEKLYLLMCVLVSRNICADYAVSSWEATAF